MRYRTGPTCSYPFAMSFERRLHLGFLKDLSRGAAFHCPQPPVLIDRNHHCGFPTQMYYVMFLRAGGFSGLWGHVLNGSGACRQSHGAARSEIRAMRG